MREPRFFYVDEIEDMTSVGLAALPLETKKSEKKADRKSDHCFELGLWNVEGLEEVLGSTYRGIVSKGTKTTVSVFSKIYAK